jgi:hypothetical protein
VRRSPNRGTESIGQIVGHYGLERPISIASFVKDGRIAVLAVTQNPIGLELRCDVDGAFTWGRTFRSGDELRTELVRLHTISLHVVGRPRLTRVCERSGVPNPVHLAQFDGEPL